MTFWYMSQVGLHVYSKKALPQGWEKIPPAEIGYHAIKMMLYYIPLRYISARHNRLAMRLYNVYCYGYPLGADSKEMLWPEDFPEDGPQACIRNGEEPKGTMAQAAIKRRAR